MLPRAGRGAPSAAPSADRFARGITPEGARRSCGIVYAATAVRSLRVVNSFLKVFFRSFVCSRSALLQALTASCGVSFVTNIRLTSSFLRPSSGSVMTDTGTNRYGLPINQEIEFFYTFGVALNQWAFIERALCDWFQLLTGMTIVNAEYVFYSARSFQGRSDMIEKILSSQTHAFLGPFLEDALRLTANYNGFRNRLAHGKIGFHHSPSSFGEGQYKLTEPLPVRISGTAEKPIIRFAQEFTLDEIRIAGMNFSRLASILWDALNAAKGTPQPSLKEYQEQVAQLPKEPYSNQPSRKEAGRRRQREAEQRSARKKSGQKPPSPPVKEGE
jgi:hypothetical protein